MLVTLLVLAPFGLALAVLSLASRRSRVDAAGRPAVPLQAAAAQGAAVPVAADLPEREDRGAFAYDNGLQVGEGGRP